MFHTEKILEVTGPAIGDGGGANGVFENEVPADDPGDNLAQGSVGIGIGRSGDGGHGGEFGVAEAGKDAGDAGDDEGQHEGGAGDLTGDLAGVDEDASANRATDAQCG